jgi:hypothetical protein
VDRRTISAASWLGSLGSFLLERLMQGIWHKANKKERGNYFKLEHYPILSGIQASARWFTHDLTETVV